MPPIRRYVRISPHSVLEVRIFLENPADGPRWLLSRSDPALPRVFAAVKPLILPKLREERERTAQTKGKGKKGKSVKDVVEGDDFRCVVFLTEGGTRHEVAIKVKTAKEKEFGRSRQAPKAAKEDKGKGRSDAVVVREEDEDEDIDLSDLPVAGDQDDDDDNGFAEIGSTRHRSGDGDQIDDADIQAYQDDKKKLGFDTRYEGFSIWGKILCLLVERKGAKSKKPGPGEGSEGAQKVMQEWISSTQVGIEDEDM